MLHKGGGGCNLRCRRFHKLNVDPLRLETSDHRSNGIANGTGRRKKEKRKRRMKIISHYPDGQIAYTLIPAS
jgi:hypothetical protein